VLQQFVPKTTVKTKYEALKPHSHEELERLKKRVERYVGACETRVQVGPRCVPSH
jgi:hypothetical protein